VERERVAEEKKAMFAADALPLGKPSKRDRRVIQRFRGR
jgi:ribosome-associated heat shock protein Hsp15